MCLQSDPIAQDTYKITCTFKIIKTFYIFRSSGIRAKFFFNGLICLLVLFADAYKVETFKKRRTTCRTKFSTFKKEKKSITSSYERALTKYGS